MQFCNSFIGNLENKTLISFNTIAFNVFYSYPKEKNTACSAVFFCVLGLCGTEGREGVPMQEEDPDGVAGEDNESSIFEEHRLVHLAAGIGGRHGGTGVVGVDGTLIALPLEDGIVLLFGSGGGLLPSDRELVTRCNYILSDIRCDAETVGCRICTKS